MRFWAEMKEKDPCIVVLHPILRDDTTKDEAPGGYGWGGEAKTEADPLRG
jgi:hypothetical protein